MTGIFSMKYSRRSASMSPWMVRRARQTENGSRSMLPCGRKARRVGGPNSNRASRGNTVWDRPCAEGKARGYGFEAELLMAAVGALGGFAAFERLALGTANRADAAVALDTISEIASAGHDMRLSLCGWEFGSSLTSAEAQVCGTDGARFDRFAERVRPRVRADTTSEGGARSAQLWWGLRHISWQSPFGSFH